MRLRTLRVIADVRLALGTFTPKAAADFMQHDVPMSAEDARTQVVEMGETHGQKISYQIGKLQIIQMMEDARLMQGEQFSLRIFHDYLWLNGNVPIALQLWEYLGVNDDVEKNECHEVTKLTPLFLVPLLHTSAFESKSRLRRVRAKAAFDAKGNQE